MLGRAALASREDAERQQRELARHAAALLERGATLRGAAKLLGVEYDRLRVLVKRGRRTGEPALEQLVEAARVRSRFAPRRPPSGPFVAEPADARRCS